MTFDNFLRYSAHQHRNVGDIPYTEANLMRMEMDASSVPFMTRKVPGGTLTLQKIYGTKYSVIWVPDAKGGRDIPLYYVAIYRKSTITYIKFLDQRLNDLGEFNATVFATETDLNEGLLANSLYSYCWFVNGLVALLRNAKLDPGDDYPQHTIEFYNPNTASIIQTYELGGNDSDTELEDAAIFIDPDDENTLFCRVTSTDNLLITVSKDVDGVYTFSTDTIDYSSHPEDGDEGATSGIWYENEKFYYTIQTNFSGGFYTSTLVTNKECTTILERFDGSMEIIDGRKIVTSYYTPSYGVEVDATAGGDPADRLPNNYLMLIGEYENFYVYTTEIPDHPLYDDQYVTYTPNSSDHVSINGNPFFTWYDESASNRKGWRMGDNLELGNTLRPRMSLLGLGSFDNPQSLNVEWIGAPIDPIWINRTRFTGDASNDTTPYTSFGGVEKTEEEFYESLKIENPENVTDFIALLCLPYLERNLEIKNTINFSPRRE